ncbi:MAG TPA: hypothetical protein VL400_03545, partial [Polyangiaceae bacterium]|nr:hypothetical protein [Polyangiaceae bacterium]
MRKAKRASKRRIVVTRERTARRPESTPEAKSPAVAAAEIDEVLREWATPVLGTPSLAPVAFTAPPTPVRSTRVTITVAAIFGVAILGGSYALARTVPRTSPQPASAAAEVSTAPVPRVAPSRTGTSTTPVPPWPTQPDATEESASGSTSLPAAMPIATSG